MDLKHYRAAVGVQTIRLKKLVAERNNLNVEIERVVDLISANANFLPESERAERLQALEQIIAEPLGFTDSVRNILSSHPNHWVTPIGARDLLVSANFDLGKYSNPLASIHTILKRLAKSEELETMTKDGEIYYRWRGFKPRLGKTVMPKK